MVLEEAGLLNPITVTADPAFLLHPEEFPAHLLRRGGRAGRQAPGRDERARAGPGRRAARRGRLPPAARPDRRLPGAPDRRVRAVRADGTRRHPARPRRPVPHDRRRAGPDPARRLPAAAGARPDAPLRPGRRHAAALPDLRRDGRARRSCPCRTPARSSTWPSGSGCRRCAAWSGRSRARCWPRSTGCGTNGSHGPRPPPAGWRRCASRPGAPREVTRACWRACAVPGPHPGLTWPRRPLRPPGPRQR